MKSSKLLGWQKPDANRKAVHLSIPIFQSASCPVSKSVTSSGTGRSAKSVVTSEPSAASEQSSLASSKPYLIAGSAFGLVLYGIFSMFQPDAIYQSAHMADECHYLSHLSLSGQYQHQKDGSVRCQSQVRYLGVNNQHSLRYMAIGSMGAIEEMRVSLRLGEYGQAGAVDELIRFGQSLSLPVLGHTMPAEVGQYLREGHVGHWDFSRASLYIERHHYPVQNPDGKAAKGAGFEDIELVFRKNRIH